MKLEWKTGKAPKDRKILGYWHGSKNFDVVWWDKKNKCWSSDDEWISGQPPQWADFNQPPEFIGEVVLHDDD